MQVDKRSGRVVAVDKMGVRAPGSTKRKDHMKRNEEMKRERDKEREGRGWKK